MAQNNRREIELALSITTANADALSKLQQDVRGLAKEGGDAAPAFQKLADELGQLAAQSKQLATLESLAGTLRTAADAQSAAAAKSGELRARLDELTAASLAARDAERQKNLELGEAKRAVQSAQDAITALKNSTSEADKSSAAYTIELVRLKDALLAAREEKRRLAGEFDALRVKTQQSSDAVSQQGRAYREAAKDTEAAARAARVLQERVDEATAKYRAAGGATDGLAAAQGALVQSYTAAKTAIAAQLAEVDRLAAAERAAAADAAHEAAVVADTKRRLAAQAQAEADGIVRDYQRMEQAQRAAAESADAAARAIQSAFGQVGTRSAQEIRQEIEKVKQAMALLANSGAATGAELSTAMARGQAAIRGLERDLREATGTLTMADKAASLFKTSMGQIAAGNIAADAVGYLVQKVKDAARAFVEIQVQTETFRRGLNAVYHDTALAAKQMDFLRATGASTGVAVQELQKSFLLFSAASKSANIPLGVSNDLFAAVTRTASSLGLSADDTSGALNALGQMASKGTVSMEELRQQLGDRMPGALGAAAKGLGLTEAELIKLVESGKLATRDFFPAFTKGLQQMQADTEGLLPTWNRLKNSLLESAQNAGDAGWTEILSMGLKGLALAAGTVLLPLNAVFETTGALLRSGGALAAAAFTWTAPWEALGEIWGGAAQRQSSLQESFRKTVDGGEAAAASAQTLTTATQAAATAAATAGAHWNEMTRSQQAAAIAAQITAARQGDLGAQVVGITAKIEELLAVQEKETTALGKIAKARKEEGDTLMALAQMRGDERASLDASVEATNAYSAAMVKMANSQEEEVRLLEIQRAAIVERRKAQGATVDAIEQETKALDAKLVVARADADQNRAQARAAEQAAAAARVARAAYEDNAAAVGKLKAAMEDARAVLEAVQSDQRRGLATDEQVIRARRDLAAAQRLYNDALEDSIRAEERKAAALVASHGLERAGLELQAAQARAAESKAIYDRNEYAALQARIKQKEVEIALLKLTAEALRTEAEATDLALNKKIEALVIEGKWTDAKASELQTMRLANAERKLQADAAKEGIANLERELKSLREGRDAHGSFTEAITQNTAARHLNVHAVQANDDALEKLNMRYKQSADYSDRQIALLEKEAAAAEKAAEAKRKYWNVDKDGFTLDANGQRQQQSVPNGAYVFNAAKGAGLTEAEALALMDKYFRDGKPAGTAEGNGINGPSRDWFSIVNEAISNAVIEKARTNSNAGNTSTNTAAPAPSAPPAEPAPTPAGRTGRASQSGLSAGRPTTVTINLNGTGRTVQTDAAGAAALQDLLREIANDRLST